MPYNFYTDLHAVGSWGKARGKCCWRFLVQNS